MQGRRPALFALGWLALAGAASAAPPHIDGIAPATWQPGQTVVFKVIGKNLEEAVRVRCTNNLQFDLLQDEQHPRKAGEAYFRVTLPADAVPSLQAVRVESDEGLSDPEFVLIDDLPTTAVEPGLSHPSAAPAIPVPGGVDGNVPPLGRHFVKFTAAAGETLSIEVFARRKGSEFDPFVRLYDERGRELAYADDSPGLNGDCQLRQTFPAAGTYVLEVRDVRYQAGRYRLRIGRFPLVSATHPLVAEAGKPVTVRAVGKASLDAPEVSLPAEAGGATGSPIAVSVIPGGGSGFASVPRSQRPQQLEVEPNNAPEQAQRIELTGDVNGRFDKANDVDLYVFRAAKDQSIEFTGLTRDRGSPADLTLQVRGADNQTLANVDDTGTSEGTLTFKAPADGDYQLLVSELIQRGGDDFVYHIGIATPPSGFSLTASDDTLTVPAGGTAALLVNAVRAGYNGPIEVRVAGLPPHVTASETVLAAGQNAAAVTIQAGDAAAPVTLERVSIVGTVPSQPGLAPEHASIAAVWRGRHKTLKLVPPWLDNDLSVRINRPSGWGLGLAAPALSVATQQSAPLKVVARRTPEFDEAIALQLFPEKDGLPKGLEVALAPIAKGQTEVEFAVTAKPELPLGDYTVALVGLHQKGEQKSRRFVPAVRISVQAAWQLAAEPRLSIKRGATAPLTVTVQRHPTFRLPVTLTLENLPPHVTAPPVTVPADAPTATFTLTAAPEVAAATIPNLIVDAKAEEGPKKWASKSAPLALVIE